MLAQRDRFGNDASNGLTMVGHQPAARARSTGPGQQPLAFGSPVESCVQLARVTGRTPSAGRAEPT